ncbi:MAG: HAD hydrolase-like protein, partial [Kiritimatiellales bacterium]
MLSAVIFDFDGIIVDSERLHWTAFNRILEPIGKPISWTDYIQTYIGFDDRDTFKTCFPTIGTSVRSDLIQKMAAA